MQKRDQLKIASYSPVVSQLLEKMAIFEYTL